MSEVKTNKISSLASNNNITLEPDGTGVVNLADNDKLTFGAGSDLQIYHDGSNSYISDQGTNDLKVLATDFQLKNAADNEFMITAVTDGAVTVYHNNAAKIATTSGGVSVTGSMTASTGISSLGVYNNTTGTGANLVVDSGGGFARSTSSQRYKNTIADATHGLTELLALRPVTYKHNGNGDTVFGGLIAEEVHTAGLSEFVDYSQDADGNDQPEALHYANMVSLCIKAIQEQQTTITALTARITALEAE